METVSVGGYQGTPASSPGASNATVIETNGAQPVNTAAQDAEAFRALGESFNQPAAPAAGAPAAKATDSDMRAKAMDWCRTNAAMALRARDTGDFKTIAAYREMNEYAHNPNAPMPASLKADVAQADPRANQAIDDNAPAYGELPTMDHASAEHLAARINAAGGNPDDGRVISEVASAMQLPHDIAHTLGQDFMKHMNSADEQGLPMQLTSDEQQDYIAEASRLYGSEQRFVQAVTDARLTLSKMPSPVAGHANALSWADKQGLTSSGLGFAPKTLNALAAYGRSKGWTK